VTSITVTFGSVVSFAPGAFQLLQRVGTGWQDVSGVLRLSSRPTADGRTVATLTFAGGWVTGGSLADGQYKLVVHAGQVSAGGVSLAADATSAFFRLYGDATGDGRVDATDLAAFLAAYRSKQGMANYRWYFDVNQDGWVDATDYYQFLVRYKTRLNADGSSSPI